MSQQQSKNTSRPANSQADVTPGAQQGSAASVARRIQASASGLVRESVLRPSASSMTRSLASSTANASKGGSESSSAGPSQTTLSSISSSAQSSSVHNSPYSTRESTEWESFRSHPRHEENSDYTDQFGFGDFTSQDSGLNLSESREWSDREEDVIDLKEKLVLRSHLSKGNVQSGSALQDSICGHTISKATGLPNGDIDGAAVVALLSDPNFFMIEDPINSSSFETEYKINVQPKMPEMDVQAAMPFNQVSAINPLDLLPDFRGSRDGVNTARSANLLAATSNLAEGYMSDKSQWQLHDGDLQPWLDMLNKYQDEVWGDILPLVQEAREEAKVAKEHIPENQPATRRLRMLLKHLA